MILELHRQGLKIAAIARQLGVRAVHRVSTNTRPTMLASASNGMGRCAKPPPVSALDGDRRLLHVLPCIPPHPPVPPPNPVRWCFERRAMSHDEPRRA